MKIFTCKPCKWQFLPGLVFSISFIFFTSALHAQFRNYNIVYTDNAKGNIVMFGNTLMHIVDNNAVNTTKMNDNSATGNSIYGNDNENMQYVDIDGSGLTGAATRNSSTADLVLPSGTNTIKLARLYWGGRVKDADFDLTQTANKKIKIRKGTLTGYSEFTALQIDKNSTTLNSEAYSQYQAFTDITSFIQTNGSGTYSIGNAPLSTGSISSGGNYGGWCIVIVYENPTLNFNSLRLYDGFQQVYNGGAPLTTTVTLTGLNVPSGTLSQSDAKMGVVAWEGDANLQGDFLKINGNTFSNGINSATNPWNGTISDNGVHVTTKNPNYTNQMGIDIDQFEVGTGYGILPNASTAVLEFGTEADQYFPGIISFVIKMKDPTITIDKLVTDANNNMTAEVGEVLTYTLKGTNLGTGNANKVVITDTLPNTVTYLPNSLKVISSPGITAGIKTDISGDDIAEFISNGSIHTVIFRLGTGANNIDGGTLASNETYEVQFKVTVNNPGTGNPIPSIINTARIKAKSDANVDYTDDGTAIINPQGGPLAVTLVYLKASLQSKNIVGITWETSLEINCKYYDVERSLDGNLFTKVATVQGNGTSSTAHAYSVSDEITAVTSPVIYYRLKQFDLDNKQNISTIVAVRRGKDSRPLIVSPNPFTSYVSISVDWADNEYGKVKVIDASGKDVIVNSIQLFKGVNYIRIDNMSKLPAGNYFIQILSSQKYITGRILKQ